MTAAGATMTGRALAESLMADACTVTRVTSQTLNESTGVLSDTATTVYTGKCRVRTAASDAQTSAGDRATMTRDFVVHLPASVTAVQVDDVVTVTASALDPGLVNLVLTVAGEARGTHVTARRLACVAVRSEEHTSELQSQR